MLVFSALTPHTPLLIPTVNREHLKQLKKTINSLEKLAIDIAIANPETIIIISEHGHLMSKAFTINTEPTFSANFKSFGDLETELNFTGAVGLAYQLKEKIETKIPLQLINEPVLNHGLSVPLYYLKKHLKQTSIIPLGHSLLDNQKHYELGRCLSDFINNSPKRIAVIASGDLAHTLSQDAPAGFSASGKIFDQTFSQLLQEKNHQGLLNLDASLSKSAVECILKPFLILQGILADYNYQTEILSYESPFGVGYLTANFELNR